MFKTPKMASVEDWLERKRNKIYTLFYLLNYRQGALDNCLPNKIIKPR